MTPTFCPQPFCRRDPLFLLLPGVQVPTSSTLVSNSILRKPELIQEKARAWVSGVGEHGVIAHSRGWEEGIGRGEKWKNKRG